mmetsp:Transcript_6037/g.15975  ORF Transcript_6037/g.15975 Transcript_6037/m.15975 type:complete len:128 (+) Transcript_6037:54-437(+)
MADDDTEPPLGLMDQFAQFMEQQDVESRVNRFVEAHASEIAQIAQGLDGEQSHDWWPLYQLYQAEFDNVLEEFIASVNTTKEEFMEAAQNAQGLQEFYLQIFLYHSQYEMFVSLMSEEARKQAEALE